MLFLILVLVLVLFAFNINADFYCRILDKESSTNDVEINAPIVYNDVVSSNALTIDCKGMQDNIIECNKIGDDDVYQLKCDATSGLLQLNCTTEYNPINPHDKSNIKCNLNSHYYYSNPSPIITSSMTRKLQENTNSESASLLLHVCSQTNMYIYINDKLEFEGNGHTRDQPWNLLKINPLVDTFSITLPPNCPYGCHLTGGFVAWINGQAIDYSHFKCIPQTILKSYHLFPFNKMTTYDDSDWPQAVAVGEWANFRYYRYHYYYIIITIIITTC